MQILDVLFVIGGLVLLIAGGEALVRGASSIATRIGMSPLIVGLIVVSAATSAPELAVTVGAVVSGEPGLAVGNVIGSNIVNILLILGLSALVMPLLIKRQLVRFDIPVMVGLSVLLVAVSLDGQIGLLDGVLLLAGLVVHAVLSILIGRREVRVGAEGAGTAPIPTPGKPVPVWLSLLLLVVGIGLLVLGSQLLVTGAVSIATGLGVSSLVVGLTVVAIGTSLPELATSIIAVRRGERDMAVGNIVGSNIFNIGMVLGLPAIIFGEGIPVPAAAIALDLPVMLATAIALLPIAFTGFIIARWEGGFFVAIYIAYTAYLVLAATQHNALEGFTDVMLWFVVPLIALTLVVVTTYEVGLHRGRRLAAREASDERSQPGG
ncbi:MAG: calcium/sodium antiporter [Actinobacteria bacterium]|nr:calcium/sodium antiporter [Actinomycetota bacterium]MBU1607969.1 calcium/sodium antiporter [Actinomycetota bacterium]MBU2316145.1 calcium/sodium antiporter [Actinomycetota bacterium]MBU2386183.1 calcium/sodium antiporter [Actinomycetota bacterium]